MDADKTTKVQRLVTALAVVFTLVWTAIPARADLLVQSPADARQATMRARARVIETDLNGNDPAGYASYEEVRAVAKTEEADPFNDVQRAQLLAVLLLIPPPVDYLTTITTAQPEDHVVVTGGPDLQVPTIPGGVTGTLDPHPQSAPEPASLLLGLIGSGLAGTVGWYRHRTRRLAEREIVGECARD